MDQSSNIRPLLQESSDDSNDEGLRQQNHSGHIIGDISDDDYDGASVLVNNHETNGSYETNSTTELIKGHSIPKDRYSFNYIIFYLLGMTTLLPWNFFITASDVSIDCSFHYTIHLFDNILRRPHRLIN